MKQISTLVYVFIDDGVYVGRGANIVLSDKRYFHLEHQSEYLMNDWHKS